MAESKVLDVAENFTRIGGNRSVQCCEGDGSEPKSHGLRVKTMRLNYRATAVADCERLCAVQKECYFFSYTAQMRHGCVLCTVCELSEISIPSDWSSWAREAGPYTPVDPVPLIQTLLAPLELNRTYSEQLYGGRDRMPPAESLRMLWLSLLPNASLRALFQRAPPCRWSARPPF